MNIKSRSQFSIKKRKTTGKISNVNVNIHICSLFKTLNKFTLLSYFSTIYACRKKRRYLSLRDPLRCACSSTFGNAAQNLSIILKQWLQSLRIEVLISEWNIYIYFRFSNFWNWSTILCQSLASQQKHLHTGSTKST